jgi:hypothetical protein
MSFPVSQLVMKSWMCAVVNPPRQQRIDELQPHQVAVVVVPDAAALLWRWQQSPFLVCPDVARSGARSTSEVVDAVFGHHL